MFYVLVRTIITTDSTKSSYDLSIIYKIKNIKKNILLKYFKI